MSIHLLDLPSEILILILSSLDLLSLISCIATNRRLKAVIDGSVLLQYRLAAQAACVDANSGNMHMTSTERLVSLQKRQNAFAELLPTSIHTISMNDFPVGNIYTLSGGMHLRDD
ncbi:hypothetical protein K438DRAFT_1970556 [Mycena galopus ATCC 62051]|nr:hypothetical protein K438DRAFT_1970556 [Mycena galopus ATCC 62051]